MEAARWAQRRRDGYEERGFKTKVMACCDKHRFKMVVEHSFPPSPLSHSVCTTKNPQTYQKSLRVCFVEIFDRISLFITLSITSEQFHWVSLSCSCLASPARFVFLSRLSESGTKTLKAFLSEISLQRLHKKEAVVSYPTRLKAFDA